MPLVPIGFCLDTIFLDYGSPYRVSYLGSRRPAQFMPMKGFLLPARWKPPPSPVRARRDSL